VFGRDMIRSIAFRENWDQIQKRKQDIINKSNQKENKSKIPYEYKVGDQVLLGTWNSPEIVNTLYTIISYNKCIQEWYDQNPKSQK
jgi:co-chaperonin GroES (HSP10)